MTKTEVIEALCRNREPLRALGVRHAAVFGSLSRGDVGPDSDVDVLLDLQPAQRTVFDLVGIEHAVADMISDRLHVAISDQLKPTLRASIMADATFAF